MTNTKILGFDAAREVGSVVDRVVAGGFSFVGRYYSHNPHKNATLGEIEVLSAHGIKTVVVWEAQGDDPHAFTKRQGRLDAQAAVYQAAVVGQPCEAPIYFAVDFDAVGSQVQAIIDYFAGVEEILTEEYPVGVYGSGLVAKTLQHHGLATYFWRGAVGWSGSRDFHDWHIIQSPPTARLRLGFQVDPNEALKEDYGGFLLKTEHLGVAVKYGDTGDRVKLVQAYLQVTPADGIFGPRTRDAVISFQRNNHRAVTEVAFVDGKNLVTL